MTFSFEPHNGLIIIDAAILGAKREVFLRLCLDTGAEKSILSFGAVKQAGIEIPENSPIYPLSIASGKISAPGIVLPKIFALGKLKENFPVYVHTLPKQAKVHGLLGLDFLRGRVLNIDFKIGEITFE